MRKKRIIVSIICILLCCFPLLSPMAEEEVLDLTPSCTLNSSLGKHGDWIYSLTDDAPHTKQDFGTAGYVQAAWTEDVPVTYLYVEWFNVPDAFTILRYDAQGQLISEEQGECRLLNQVIYVGNGVQAIRLQGDALVISTLKVCGGETLPYNYHDWEEPEKLDYLIVATHPDDDTLFMGGVAPTLSNRDLQGTIVYLVSQNRLRRNEAMNGAWKMGVRLRPLMGGFPDISTNWNNRSYCDTMYPEEAITQYLVRLFRQYKPEVVFTHDINGEYGHWQHKRCSAATQKAVELVSDPTYDPESAAEYGVWTVKKLYLHLYEENAIHISMTQPLNAYDGRTAYLMAKDGFEEHVSQHSGKHKCINEGVYSLEDFGLYYTTVGLDEKKDDFMEHIDPATLTNYVPPTPTPSPEPTPEPTPTPTCTPAPTKMPTPETALSADPQSEGESLNRYILLVAAVLLLVACAGLVLLKRKSADKGHN